MLMTNPTLLRLFMVSFKIGTLSFGGGISVWMYNEIVKDRSWLTEHEFLCDLSTARVLPGTNVTNLNVIIGYRLLGIPGSIVSLLGLLTVPFIAVIILAVSYDDIRSMSLDAALQGAAAGAIGPAAAITLKSVKHGGNTWYAGVVLIVTAAVGIANLPVGGLLAIIIPISIILVIFFRKN